jgi:hypothetical protein
VGSALAVVACFLLGACQAPSATDDSGKQANSAPLPLAAPSGPAPSGPVAAVCDNTEPGPANPPAGAVVVDPADAEDLDMKTQNRPPGTTFWLAPGTHTLPDDEYGQVGPKDRNRYIGAPGAILDGRGINRYAFSGKASGVTIDHLTVRGFAPPAQEGVVNHDSGDGWIVEHSTIEENNGAGLMMGFGSQVRHNCLRNNGQYGMNGFGGDVVVAGNEIVGNNTDDLENTIEGGCGCTGGVKFWDVDGADIRNNWVHDNRGTALWADTNNNNFVIEGNVIENNDGSAVFYETSYNLVLRNNLIRNNAYATGREFADRDDNFPVASIYISESGGEPRVPARTDKIEIYGNVLENNWSGITLWENADRFCNSASNTSTGYCTRLVESVTDCAAPAIDDAPLVGDCRWKTQRVDIHDNTFTYEPGVVGCSKGMAGRMAVFANYGTVPEWSPYQGRTVQQAITFEQENVWHDNTYRGPWKFVAFETSQGFATAEWQAEPHGQDAGSTFIDNSASPAC